MKKLILLSSMLALFACKKESNKPYSGNTPDCNTPEQLGKEMVAAMSEGSIEHYMKLTPSLNDLHLLMDSQAAVYGANMQAAKSHFAKDYEEKIIPSFKNSFLDIRKKGNESRINWNEISFKGVELLGTINEKSSVEFIPIYVLFSYHDKVHSFLVEKAIRINNKWTISQYTTLE